MAASMWRMNGRWGRMAGVLVLCTLLLSNVVLCQDESTKPPATAPTTYHSSPPTNLPVQSNAVAGTASSGPAAGQTADATHSVHDGQPFVAASPENNIVKSDSLTNTKLDSEETIVTNTDKKTGAKTEAQSSTGSSVFVGILVSGLLTALALTVGYFKCQRKPDIKGVRLADEAYPVDQENQGNTLESVAPLNPPPETQEKPSVNGESPEAAKTQPPPPTNGHSTTKTADTEL